MAHPPRILILPLAAVIIFGLTMWRIYNPRQGDIPDELPEARRPAPAFHLYDQQKPQRLVKLDAFLHRHTIVVVFYDGKAGPEADPVLVQLREFYPALKRERVIVLGVSTALPQENRNNSSQPFPFPLLSDVAATDPESVHRVWGRFIEPESLDKPAGTKPAVFIIDRAGNVAWDGKFPKPESDRDSVIPRLLKG